MHIWHSADAALQGLGLTRFHEPMGNDLSRVATFDLCTCTRIEARCLLGYAALEARRASNDTQTSAARGLGGERGHIQGAVMTTAEAVAQGEGVYDYELRVPGLRGGKHLGLRQHQPRQQAGLEEVVCAAQPAHQPGRVRHRGWPAVGLYHGLLALRSPSSWCAPKCMLSQWAAPSAKSHSASRRACIALMHCPSRLQGCETCAMRMIRPAGSSRSLAASWHDPGACWAHHTRSGHRMPSVSWISEYSSQ